MKNLIPAVQTAVVSGILTFTTTTTAKAQAGAWSDVGGGLGEGFNDIVQSFTVHDDGTGEALYAGGTFLTAGGQPASHVARWDGQSWSPVGAGIPGPGGIQNSVWVMALQVFDDGSGAGPRLYAGGHLFGDGMGNIAVWDGQTWSQVGGGVSGTVYTMEVFDDGAGPALYVGGAFTSAGGQPVSRIAKWDGRTWSDVGGGVGGVSLATALDMLVWDDGGGPGLVVAGRFTQAGTGAGKIVTRGIARWRNGAWSTFGEDGLGPFAPYARCLATWPPGEDSVLVVGGRFGLPDPNLTGALLGIPPHAPPIVEVEFSGLALWNRKAWKAWQDIAPEQEPDMSSTIWGTHGVHTIRVGDCDQLFILGGYAETLLQHWNGDIWKPMGAGIGGSMWGWSTPGIWNAFVDFETFQGQVYVGGGFATVDGIPVNNIAVWDPYLVLQCAADVNRDGEIDADDLIAVILQWGPCDDCTADNAPCGGDGDVNVDDLVSVILSWGPCS